MGIAVGKSFLATLSQKKVSQLQNRFRVSPLQDYSSPFYVKESILGDATSYARGYPLQNFISSVQSHSLGVTEITFNLTSPALRFYSSRRSVSAVARARYLVQQSARANRVMSQVDEQAFFNLTYNVDLFPVGVGQTPRGFQERAGDYNVSIPSLWPHGTTAGRADIARYGDKTGLMVIAPYKRLTSNPTNFLNITFGDFYRGTNISIYDQIPLNFRNDFNYIKNVCEGKQAIFTGRDKPTNTGDLFFDKVFMSNGIQDAYDSSQANLSEFFLCLVFYFKDSMGNVVNLTPPATHQVNTMNDTCRLKYNLLAPRAVSLVGGSYTSNSFARRVNSFPKSALMNMDISEGEEQSINVGPATSRKVNVSILGVFLRGLRPPKREKYFLQRPLSEKVESDEIDYTRITRAGLNVIRVQLLDYNGESLDEYDGEWSIDGKVYRLLAFESFPARDGPILLLEREYASF